MFKVFGVAVSILIFVAMYAVTNDNLIALLAALCFLALEHWQRKTKEFYRRSADDKPFVSRALPNVARKPQQDQQSEFTGGSKEGAQAGGDYRSTPSYRKLLTACGGDRRTVERLIDYEIKQDPRLTRSAATVSALDRLYVDRRHFT
ncbi:hypothetical protein PQU96_13575 [Vogesella sp. LYT5W]|uniref:Uncharacterized protein n=1 Tax=Vogesella margarita TaxID=2984199 RepID=A0ABT5IRJ1_9NEIS|nr:hypothetical protein [Vogesella margarita]MDC7715142.1 hypothetical protein [Vogesella margarita]